MTRGLSSGWLAPLFQRFSPREECFSAGALDHWRAAATMPTADALRLVKHLSDGCARCWAALEALPPLATPDPHRPTPAVLLVPSAHPVVRALRALGGWPPRAWLHPRHRMLCEDAREPFGFHALVIEEAHRLAEHDLGPDAMKSLLLWVNRVNDQAKARKGKDSPGRRAIERILISGHVALAANQLARGDRRAAEMSLDWAERSLPSAPGPACSDALIARVRARLEEARKPEVARALFELAIARVRKAEDDDERFRTLRIEILLDQAAFYLRHDALAPAERTIYQASDLLEELDEPLLRYWLDLLRARFALARAERVETVSIEAGEHLESELVPGGDLRGIFPELLRLAHHTEASALVAGLPLLPQEIDWRAVHARVKLQDHLAEIIEGLAPEALEQKLAELHTGIAAENGHAHADVGLRILLAGAKAIQKPLEGRKLDLEPLADTIASLVNDLHRAPQRKIFKETLAVARLYLGVSLSCRRTLHPLTLLTRYCLLVIDHLVVSLEHGLSAELTRQAAEQGEIN